MFKNKKVTITVDKKDKDETNEARDSMHFERNTLLLLRNLEKLGKKAFVGLILYVVADTVRQVTVANANNPTPQS